MCVIVLHPFTKYTVPVYLKAYGLCLLEITIFNQKNMNTNIQNSMVTLILSLFYNQTFVGIFERVIFTCAKPFNYLTTLLLFMHALIGSI